MRSALPPTPWSGPTGAPWWRRAVPFDDVVYEGGRRFVIGQANNVFIFPGVGLGAILAELQEIPRDIFYVAARTLADCVSEERLALGALYPSQNDLRKASKAIAAEVVRYASERNLGPTIEDDAVDELVETSMWDPEYIPVVLRGRDHRG